MSPLDVQTASFDELSPRTAYLLWQLREAVFVVEQTCPYPELDGRDLEPGTRHLWIEVAGAPIAYLRILEDVEQARIGRVLVADTHRGIGLAERLMRQALEQIGERACHLDAQTYLEGWYQRLGFEPTGPQFIEDGIPHLPMARNRGSYAPPATAG